MIPSIESARFEAELGSTAAGGGTLFLAGNLCAYDIQRVVEAASYRVGQVSVRLFGTNLEQALRTMRWQLEGLERRGVDVSVVTT